MEPDPVGYPTTNMYPCLNTDLVFLSLFCVQKYKRLCYIWTLTGLSRRKNQYCLSQWVNRSEYTTISYSQYHHDAGTRTSLCWHEEENRYSCHWLQFTTKTHRLGCEFLPMRKLMPSQPPLLHCMQRMTDISTKWVNMQLNTKTLMYYSSHTLWNQPEPFTQRFCRNCGPSLLFPVRKIYQLITPPVSPTLISTGQVVIQ